MKPNPPPRVASTEHMVDYDRHSDMQNQAVRSQSATLSALVEKIGVVKPEFVMLDCGCGPGRSAIETVRPVVEAYRRLAPTGSVVIRHGDQPGNDWNALFSIAYGEHGYRQDDDGIRSEAAIGSFYTMMAAPASVALGTCFAASHWLSRAMPLYSPGTVWFADLEGEARDRFAALARADWVQFLRCRARELLPGGYLMVSTLGSVADHGEPNNVRASASKLYRAVHLVGQQMVDDGLLSATALDHFLFPLWFPTANEMRQPIDEEPDLAEAFEVIEASLAPAAFHPNDVYETELDDPANYARLYAGYVRGFGESSLRLHLFSRSAEDATAVDGLTEEFFRRFTKLYEDAPGAHASETMIVTLILRRR